MRERVYSAACLFLVVSTSASSLHAHSGVLRHVNPKIGTFGVTPNGNGGMIPSVAPPFAMTRTPQTRENFISQCPYNDADQHIHGFQATHQPAIWMGESGHVVLTPGMGDVEPLFTRRAHRFNKSDEVSTAYLYEVTMDAEAIDADHNLTESTFSPVPGGAQPVPAVVSEGANGRTRRAVDVRPAPTSQPLPQNAKIKVSMSATSHVGHARFHFNSGNGRHGTQTSTAEPYVFVQATRQNWTGHIDIDASKREISGSNSQRQDYALGPSRAPKFRGYFVSRFSQPFESHGIARGGDLHAGVSTAEGQFLGGYVKFPSHVHTVEIRTGVSFVSVEQARRNLDIEAPDHVTFEDTVEGLKQAWLEKLGRVHIEGSPKTDAEHDPRTIFYTGLFHALQYPNDFSEPLTNESTGPRTFYSGYTDSVHTSHDSYYQSWSIWDTFRAEHSLLTLFAPERVNHMMRSLLRIFEWSGRLPMWANIVETNIQIGTHVDAVLANALERGFRSFDVAQAWAGVKKNAFVPPVNDTGLLYFDREAYTPNEVRAGLTEYRSKGYVPNDRWAESASRTLDYAFDDYAASVVAAHAGDHASATLLRNRSLTNYRTIYNADTTFMEARNANGTWAGPDQGWTEGDEWIYTFDVMHDALGLASLLGGPARMKGKLDVYFDGGHNDHSNEPSHHAPYLYAAIGRSPASTQRRVRSIAAANYNASSAGLSGNEDLGQMSAWYVFSALGFYPVNPASDEYVVGSPFFDKVTLRLPPGVATGGVQPSPPPKHGRKQKAAKAAEDGGHELVISAPGAASNKPYVKSLTVDGKPVEGAAVLKHAQIVRARRIEFEMAATPQAWGEQR